jgi:hypothetical protein
MKAKSEELIELIEEVERSRVFNTRDHTEQEHN